MKKQKIRLIVVLAALLCVSSSYSQLNTVTEMLSGFQESQEDVNKLFQAYVTPYGNALGANLSAGWYNTAKPHKLGGFDLTFTFNMSFVPDADKEFDLNTLGLSNGVVIGGDGIAPTAAGKREEGPSLQYTTDIEVAGVTQTIPLVSFNTPKGSGIGFIPTPMIQLGIGLIKGTDVTVRYMPTIPLGDNGEIGLWGVGGKHSIKQWIPVLEKIPIFNLTLFGGYTKMNTDIGLDFTPDDLSTGGITVLDQTSDAVSFDDQHMLLEVKSFTMSILVSADFPIVCFYGGLGFASTNTNLKLEGNFPTPTADIVGGLPVAVVNDGSVVTDPINVSIKNKDGGTTKPRLNAGMRIKLGVVTIHGDFTRSDYSIVTAGLGISFR